jgi:hypothetical protein
MARGKIINKSTTRNWYSVRYDPRVRSIVDEKN